MGLIFPELCQPYPGVFVCVWLHPYSKCVARVSGGAERQSVALHSLTHLFVCVLRPRAAGSPPTPSPPPHHPGAGIGSAIGRRNKCNTRTFRADTNVLDVGHVFVFAAGFRKWRISL